MKKLKRFLQSMKKPKKIGLLAAMIVAGIATSAFAQTITVIQPQHKLLTYAANNCHGFPMRTYYKTTKSGQPVYCLKPNLEDPDNVQETSQFFTDGVVSSVLQHGYPYNNFGGTQDQAYYITQLAAWIAYGDVGVSGMNVPGVTWHVNPISKGNLPDWMWNAAINLVKEGIAHPLTANHYIYVTPNTSTFHKEGDTWVSDPITLHSFQLEGGQVKITLQGAPNGTTVVDASTNKVTDMLNYGDTFVIKLPKGCNVSNSFTVNYNLTTVGATMKEAVYCQPNAAQIKTYQTVGYFGTFPATETSTKGSVTFNRPLTSVTVHKVSASNGNSLEGATFELIGPDGKVIGTQTTNDKGICTWSNLPYGTYHVKETKAPQDYSLNTQEYTADANSASGAYVTVKDTIVHGTVVAVKYSESTGKFLPGCTFGLYYPNGKLYGEAVTQADGKATWTNVPGGQYYVKEIKAPQGYQLSDKQIPVNVTSGGNGIVGVKMADSQILGTLHFFKIDATTKARLAGAKFGLFENGKQIATTVTRSNGEGSFGDLHFGSYQVRELQAPKGYKKSNQIWNVTIDSNDVQNLPVFTFTDQEIPTNLTIIKIDAQKGTKLAGAEFGLFENGKQLQTATTGADGSITFNGVPFGTYQVKELKAPTGYELSNAVWTVKVDADNAGTVMTYTFKDNEITQVVSISKIDATTQKEVPGAHLKVTCTSGIDKGQTWSWTSTNTPHQLTLPYGTYTLHEVAAPQGYLVNTSNITFQVGKDGKPTQQVVMKDKRITNKVLISKEDMTTSKPVEGAHIKVTCTEGFDKGKTWTWVSGLTPHELDLPYGTYKYEEVAAPAGYLRNTAIGTFKVEKEGQTIKCVIKDKRITGQLVVTKENASTGAKLSGAQFAIYNDKGQIVAKGVTGTNGTASFTLPYGTYYCQEIKAPKGFGLLSEKREFQITQEGEVVNVVVKDTALPDTAGLNPAETALSFMFGFIAVGAIALVYSKRKATK